jgi:hypothetical protein
MAKARRDTDWAIVVIVIVVVVLLAGALILFASTDCSQTETGCRHNEIDIN